MEGASPQAIPVFQIDWGTGAYPVSGNSFVGGRTYYVNGNYILGNNQTLTASGNGPVTIYVNGLMQAGNNFTINVSSLTNGKFTIISNWLIQTGNNTQLIAK